MNTKARTKPHSTKRQDRTKTKLIALFRAAVLVLPRKSKIKETTQPDSKLSNSEVQEQCPFFEVVAMLSIDESTTESSFKMLIRAEKTRAHRLTSYSRFTDPI